MRKVDELLKIYSELLAADLEQACIGMWADVFCRRLIVDAGPDDDHLREYLQGVLRGMWQLMESLIADGRDNSDDADAAVLAGSAERVSAGVLAWFARDFTRHGRNGETPCGDELVLDNQAARKAIFMSVIGDDHIGHMEHWLHTAKRELVH